ncbi:hypothetical protein [Devosia chinhatensis]|uniref:hypothetical protein n=1 Tax=Devosia chinhatensis TaxID=429727 RepID=UPI000A9FFC67|nr:hypothetical protein [Devosia chinhatensis]
MSSVFSRVLTLLGGVTFAVAAVLALISGSADLPLNATVAMVGLGIVQIYR